MSNIFTKIPPETLFKRPVRTETKTIGPLFSYITLFVAMNISRHALIKSYLASIHKYIA